MDKETRKSAIAAFCILFGFGIAAHYLPKVMLAVGSFSPVLGGVVAVAFVVAFFLVFWLRGRVQRKD